MSEVTEQHTEVVETQTVTTKTTEDGSVVTEITVTKIVTGDEGEETTTTITTTEGAVTENGDTEPAKEDECENKPEEKTESTKEVEDDGKVDADADVEVTGAAAVVQVEEEKKEEQTPPIVHLHQFPAGKNVPNYSMFCLKLETFLRINKIPFVSAYSFKAGKKGKSPWIEYKGEKVPDSSFCIDFLNNQFNVDLDKDLSNVEKATARAFKVMLEENTYWTVVYHRWVEEYSEFKKIVSPPSSGIGFTVGFKLNQRKIKSQLEHHGIGRHTKEEIYEIAEKDLRALSEFLGEKTYFMGDQITTLDCTAFGLLANIMYDTMESPMSKLVKQELKNLVAYCERVKEEYYSDWNDVVQGDKPEPNISKKYSFRKNKKKKDKKEEKKDEEAAQDGDESEKKSEEQATNGDGETTATPAQNGDAKEEATAVTAE